MSAFSLVFLLVGCAPTASLAHRVPESMPVPTPERAPNSDPDSAVSRGGTSNLAVLIYQEGTAEEQIYPVSASVSIGSGRGNDIEIKNDARVVSEHCRIFADAGLWNVESIGSAATLVNGERATTRRLFGGEEIIVGETFFRFRLLD